MRRDLYHPWTPDVGQMQFGGWQVGCVMPREVKVDVVAPVPEPKGKTAFAEWLKGVSDSKTEMRVPGEIISLGEDICSCRICGCGCYTNNDEGKQYRIIKRGNTWFHDKCGDRVGGLSKFTTWLRQAKTERPRARKLRVPGEIVELCEHICSCRVTPSGSYRTGGLHFTLEKRNGVFVHSRCGEAVE